MIRAVGISMAMAFVHLVTACQDSGTTTTTARTPYSGSADGGVAPLADGGVFVDSGSSWVGNSDGGADGGSSSLGNSGGGVDASTGGDPLAGGGTNGGPLSIVATRTSGVAPLLVHFEGDLHPGQTSAAPFHDLDYAWDFDDAASGYWSTSGASKSTDAGPITAHVFEEPGTYTVRLEVRDLSGTLTTGTVQITVDDPDVVFAGSKTVCVSGAGVFDGCPAAATHVTTASTSQAMGYLASGTRLLFHRGESFDGGVRINVAGPGIVGAYGNGSAPRLALSGSEPTGVSLSGSNPQLSDWRVMDFEIDGSGGSSASAVVAGGTVHDTLVLRVTAHDIVTGFEFSHFVLAYYHDVQGNDAMTFHDGVGIVDSSASHFLGSTGRYGAFLSGNHVAVLGTNIDLNASGEHVVRVSTMQASVFGHDVFSHPLAGKHCLKLHATEWSTGSTLTDGVYTERVVVRRSTFVGAANDWLVVPGPENETSDERVRDVIFDGNFFVAGAGTQVGLVVECPRVTARNNVFDMSAGFDRTCMTISSKGIAPAPSDIAALQNTCYSSAGSISILGGTGGFPNVSVVNNVAAGPGGASVGASSSATAVVTGNLATGSPGFVSAQPKSVADFEPSASSQMVDDGAPLTVLVRDLLGVLRPVGAAPDVGAFERE